MALTDKLNELNIARRDLLINCLRGGGALVLGCSLPGRLLAAGADAPAAGHGMDPARLDAWIVVNRDGDITAYWGKMDMGQGVDTAISQMIAEELDVPAARVDVIFGDSDLCVDQGGASGSTGVRLSGVALRAAAAEARRELTERAAARLGLPVPSLAIDNGVVHAKADPSRRISYGDLVGADFAHVPLQWNGKYGNSLRLKTRARLKSPADYSVVGTPVARKDLPGKIIPATAFTVHRRLPGMLHGRMLRPAVAGATVRAVDRESIAHIPGARAIVKNDFVGVVAPREWDAIRAARALKVEWDEQHAGFPTTSEELHEWIRRTTPVKSEVARDIGDVDRALAAAARTVEARYVWPFQSHARMGPAIGMADVRDKTMTVWTDSQKYYDTIKGAASLVGISGDVHAQPSPLRVIWSPGAGSYGRSDSGDGAMDATVLSWLAGAPVRVQWMRYEGQAWDPKGPAAVITARAGLDAAGTVLGYHYHLKGFSRKDMNSREDGPGEVLAGHLLGHKSDPEWDMQTPDESYGFASKRYSWAAVPPLRLQASPLRTSHFRDPYGPEVHFAAESFIDELAYAAGVDPVAFRLRYVTGRRDAAVIRAAAELAGWEPRTAPRRRRGAGGVLTGTGISYARRGDSVNAIVAEVEVNPGSGRVWVRNFYVGADHGLIINPNTLSRTIEGNLLQATSRTLFEEVHFDRRMVKAVDWITYPILEAGDAPLDIKIKHLNQLDMDPSGAGEATTRVTPASIANAVYDATGVRMRKVPLTPERVKAALASV